MKTNASQSIDAIVSPDGSTRVETKGFEGPDCREASRFLETALGTKQSERLTSEFYAGDVHQSQTTRQR